MGGKEDDGETRYWHLISTVGELSDDEREAFPDPGAGGWENVSTFACAQKTTLYWNTPLHRDSYQVTQWSPYRFSEYAIDILNREGVRPMIRHCNMCSHDIKSDRGRSPR